MIVLDASMAGPLCIADEASNLATAAFGLLITGPIWVPAHWHVEAANMLRSAVRRQRLTVAGRTAAYATLRRLPLNVDREGWEPAWARVVALSDQHELTPFDAAYLELAERLGGLLATRDAALASAGVALGISVTDPRR